MTRSFRVDHSRRGAVDEACTKLVGAVEAIDDLGGFREGLLTWAHAVLGDYLSVPSPEAQQLLGLQLALDSLAEAVDARRRARAVDFIPPRRGA